MAAKVLLISPYGDELAHSFSEGDQIEWRGEPQLELNEDADAFDWIVSYGCREIIREPWLTIYKNRIINIHISYLPFNRGADPNFWSWFDNTPKGVSVHMIDAGMDTGPIIDQSEVRFQSPEKHTLATSYTQLRKAAPLFFEYVWGKISRNNFNLEPQKEIFASRTHRSKDKEQWMKMLPLKWDTPVLEVSRLGDMQKEDTLQ